jgi:tetratricopeptide (TPR) repeat protein
VTLLGGLAQGAAPKPPGQNLEAYTALLQGRYYFRRHNEDGLRQAIQYYEDAIHRDPGYALAYAELATAEILLATSIGVVDAQSGDLISRARVAAEKALQLDGDLAQAHYAHAFLLQNDALDVAASGAEFEKALALAPQDALFLLSVGTHNVAVGRFDEAVAYCRQSVAVDPLLPSARLYYARALIAAHAYGDAEAEIRKAIELQPEASGLHMLLATLRILRSDPPGAVEFASQETSPFWRLYAVALAQYAAGDRAKSDAAVNQLVDQYANSGGAQIAGVYAFRKEPDKMFEWLERARAAHDPGVLFIKSDAFLSTYKDDPRYAVMEQKLGLPP